jgi:hypothetical protein
MKRDVQLFITTITAAALTNTGCDNMNHVPTLPTLTAPPIVAPAPPAAIDGVYRLTFTSAPSCQLPDDAMRRTYTATIRTAGDRTVATLTGAQFWTDGYCGLMNSFHVYVSGNTVSFSDYGGDCGIIEQLSSTRYLKLWGTAKAVVAEPISAAFDAIVRVTTPDGSNGSYPIATCTASDHQLVFERTAP